MCGSGAQLEGTGRPVRATDRAGDAPGAAHRAKRLAGDVIKNYSTPAPRDGEALLGRGYAPNHT